MLFSEIKANETYFSPNTSPLSILEIKVTSIDSSGYDYSYEDYQKKVIKGRYVKYEGKFSPNDNINIFSKREDAKNHLKEDFERRIKEL